MTALAGLISDRDRRRLLERLDQAEELGRLMRERGTLASVPEPAPLHRRRVETKFTTKSNTERTLS
jgi:hypothetical protein